MGKKEQNKMCVVSPERVVSKRVVGLQRVGERVKNAGT
jgi:hypothetical protein